MNLTSHSFSEGDRIPHEFAFGVPSQETHMELGSNRNPHLAWTDPPPGTRSFALIVHDPDVPTRGDDVNTEGRVVPYDLPRQDFFHWVLVDIPANLREIPAGAVSSEVTPRGKPGGATRYGRAGRNDYSGLFAGDPEMGGEYHGYDGPCPPWNDERLHHYVFTLYALDTERLDLPERFGGHDVREAIRGHVLEEARLEATYSLFPAPR